MLIADTGPLVARRNAKGRYHEACTALSGGSAERALRDWQNSLGLDSPGLASGALTQSIMKFAELYAARPRRGGRVTIWTGSGTLLAMKFTAADLVATLAASPEESYVRVVADWLAHGEVAPAGPALTGRRVVDALVAAGTAHLARLNETEAPAWTQEPTRILPSFWHPGSDRFFAYSLAHAPAEFAVRGILVEQDSLVSV